MWRVFRRQLAILLSKLGKATCTPTLIEGGTFQDEVEARGILAVPATFLNGEPFYNGKMELAEILAKLDSGADAKAAEKLAAKEPFDVLVVGGGPAGTASAIYTARKGFRTGIAAERFGGQLQDTLGIENLPGTAYTEGPKLAGDLRAQVIANEIDVMDLARATALKPATQAGGMHELTLANGAVLKARSLILSTGARWRNLGVPGEAEYRNKGVAYCPHCDGPLFKGRKVAVIGGGNSGVEAAIDLAGIVAHVTLLEFADQLKADAVLVNKLQSLPNVDIHTSAQTLEITGDGQKVNGLRYKDRSTGREQTIDLAGVFVQIGLVPNTEWLQGVVERSRYGEILIDDRCATSVPGIYAAGDATTVPYKQIIVASGEGSKAALSAFDHLIRQPAVV